MRTKEETKKNVAACRVERLSVENTSILYSKQFGKINVFMFMFYEGPA